MSGPRQPVAAGAVAGVALGLLLVFVAAGPGGADLAPPPPVYVIGDSVVLGAEGAIVGALAPAPVIVDAQVSRSLVGAVSVLQQARPAIADVAVVALGTNDGTDPVEFSHRVDLVMAALQGVPHVLWIDQGNFGPGRAALNDQLRAATARYPTLHVLDWNAVVAANPGDVGPDGIHVTPAGAAAMAALVRQGVDDVRAADAAARAAATTTVPLPASTAAVRTSPEVAVRTLPTSPGPPVGVIVLATTLALLVVGAGMLLLAYRKAERGRSTSS